MPLKIDQQILTEKTLLDGGGGEGRGGGEEKVDHNLISGISSKKGESACLSSWV